MATDIQWCHYPQIDHGTWCKPCSYYRLVKWDLALVQTFTTALHMVLSNGIVADGEPMWYLAEGDRVIYDEFADGSLSADQAATILGVVLGGRLPIERYVQWVDAYLVTQIHTAIRR